MALPGVKPTGLPRKVSEEEEDGAVMHLES